MSGLDFWTLETLLRVNNGWFALSKEEKRLWDAQPCGWIYTGTAVAPTPASAAFNFKWEPGDNLLTVTDMPGYKPVTRTVVEPRGNALTRNIERKLAVSQGRD